MALNEQSNPQAEPHDAGEISPTSLDTVGTLSPHDPQAELPGIRATIALAQTMGNQEVNEAVYGFNQKQRYVIERREKRLKNDNNLIALCEQSGHPLVQAYGRKLALCASGGLLVSETENGALLMRHVGPHCNRAHCAECRHRNNRVYIKRITPVLERQLEQEETRLRYVVLTMPNCANTPEALKASIDAAKAAMTKLRRQAFFKAATFGTIETFEYTKNPETGELNPHLNVLIAGPAGSEGYIEQERLSDEWRKLTGAYIVNIQAVLHGKGFGPAKALQELVKYIAKGMEFTTAQDVETLILGTQGKRLRCTTGCFYQPEPSEQEQAEAEVEEQTQGNEAVISKESVSRAAPLFVVPLSEITLLYEVLDAGVRLAPAFHYAATGSLPITALASPKPPTTH